MLVSGSFMTDNISNTSFKELKAKIQNELDLEILKFSEEQKAKREGKRRWINSPLTAIILSAIFTLFGTGIGAWYQGRANMELEKQRFQADLILKMIETNGDQKKAALNLEFLIKTGLIENDSLKERIEKIIENPVNVPTLGIIDTRLKEKNPTIVKQIQEQLKMLKYYYGEINGLETSELSNAVKKFQKDNDLLPDGMVSFMTISKIENMYNKLNSN